MRGCVGALVAKLRRSPLRRVDADEAPALVDPSVGAARDYDFATDFQY